MTMTTFPAWGYFDDRHERIMMMTTFPAWGYFDDHRHEPNPCAWKMMSSMLVVAVVAVMMVMYVVKGSLLVLAPRTLVPLESAPESETVPPYRGNPQLEKKAWLYSGLYQEQW
jgi:hypothetical protein